MKKRNMGIETNTGKSREIGVDKSQLFLFLTQPSLRHSQSRRQSVLPLPSRG